MPNLITPDDLFQPSPAGTFSSAGDNLRNAIIYKHQADQQQRQFDSMMELERQRASQSFDLGVGQQNILKQQVDNENARGMKALNNEAKRDAATIEHNKGLLANDKIVAESTADLNKSMAEGNRLDNEGKRIALAEKFQAHERTMKNRAGEILTTAAKNNGMTVKEYIRTDAGRNLLYSLLDDYNNISPKMHALANTGTNGADRFTSQIRRGQDGRFVLARADRESGKVEPIMAGDSMLSFDEDGLASYFADTSGRFDTLAQFRDQLTGANAERNEAALPEGQRGGAQNVADIARGRSATANLLENVQGSGSAQVANITQGASPNRLDQVRVTSNNLGNVDEGVTRERIDAKMVRASDQTTARLFTDEGRTEFEIFGGKSKDAASMQRNAGVYATAVLQRRAAAIAPMVGADETQPVDKWSDQQIAKAHELIVESQRGKKPNTLWNRFLDTIDSAAEGITGTGVKGAGAVGLLSYVDLAGPLYDQDGAAPMPSHNELRAASKRLGLQ